MRQFRPRKKRLTKDEQKAALKKADRREEIRLLDEHAHRVNGIKRVPQVRRRSRPTEAEQLDSKSILRLNFDGASKGNPGPAGYGYIARVNGQVLTKGSVPLEDATNNVAEYAGAIAALRFANDYLARNGDIRTVAVYGDSNLVVCQLTGKWKMKNAGLRMYYSTAMRHLAKLRERATVTIEWVPRERNRDADDLADGAARRGMQDAGCKLAKGGLTDEELATEALWG